MAFGKRIDKPGGSRKAAREDLVLRAVIMTVTDTISVDLLDISKLGARLRAYDLPNKGQEVIALLGGLEAFATMVWRKGDEGGIQFDVPLSDRAVSMIEAERVPTIATGFEADSGLAARDWQHGFPRQ